jgi:hypothetical protein
MLMESRMRVGTKDKDTCVPTVNTIPKTVTYRPETAFNHHTGVNADRDP